MTTSDEEQAIAAAWSALHQGDLFRVLDLVQAGAGGARPRRLDHLEVLARARLGDLDEALALYERLDLASFDDLDAQALRARLLKDQALGESPAQAAALGAVADAYEAVFEHFRQTYPLINAASAALLAGQHERARLLAEKVLAMLPTAPPTYFEEATRAEALLLLGDLAASRASLAEACLKLDAAQSARTSTRRQFRLVAAALGLSHVERADLLHPLASRPVVSYCGEPFAASPALEAELAVSIGEVLAEKKPAVAYGTLSQGADIVIAECLLQAGIELHIVLPFRESDVLAHLVTPDWHTRYATCVAGATSVTFATEGEFVGDPHQLRYGADVAMGLARIRARLLDAEAFQLVVWDGISESGIADTAAYMAQWQQSGGVTREIVPKTAWPGLPPATVCAVTDTAAPERMIKAILFADFPGFSKLPESLLPIFWREVMQRIAQVLDRYGDKIVYRNTWGDAIYTVIESAEVAVAVAFDLHDALAQVDRRMLRIDSSAQMRIGLHLGPVYRGRDFVTGEMNYYGTEVSRTARIEPITPAGAIYVTESFAAILALEDPEHFSSRYVGRLEMAKGYGTQRMYRVSRLGAVSPPG